MSSSLAACMLHARKAQSLPAVPAQLSCPKWCWQMLLHGSRGGAIPKFAASLQLQSAPLHGRLSGRCLYRLQTEAVFCTRTYAVITTGSHQKVMLCKHPAHAAGPLPSACQLCQELEQIRQAHRALTGSLRGCLWQWATFTGHLAMLPPVRWAHEGILSSG